jgi:hypothetical protein
MAVENDIVLIYIEDQPVSFARIESILPDHKRGWFHLALLLLQIPLQTTTWILRDAYINGEEFTMGGSRMRLEKVVCPKNPDSPVVDDSPDDKKNATGSSKIISFRNPGKKT